MSPEKIPDMVIIPIKHTSACFGFVFKFKDKMKFSPEKLYEKYNIRSPGFTPKNIKEEKGKEKEEKEEKGKGKGSKHFDENKYGLKKGFVSRLKKKDDVQYKGGLIKHEDVLLKVRGKVCVIFGDTSNGNSSGFFDSDEYKKVCGGISDLVVHECTFEMSMIERAKKTGHSTPDMLADTYFKLNAKRLIITHFSNRYDSMNTLRDEVISCGIQNVEIAEDFKIFKV